MPHGREPDSRFSKKTSAFKGRCQRAILMNSARKRKNAMERTGVPEKRSSRREDTTFKGAKAGHESDPTAQPECRLFLLPAELRNAIYLLVAEHDEWGLLRSNRRDQCTSLDPISLTCKYIRYEYLDILAKNARTLVARSTDSGFCNTLLLRHEMADQTQPFGVSRKKKASRGRRRRDVHQSV